MPPNPKGGVAVEVGFPPELHRRLSSTGTYKNEQIRLQSFAGYPHSSADVRQLAAAGFYFTKMEDIVRCAFCGVEVGRWEEGDNPREEHKKWSKNCRFLTGAYVGNVPIDPANPPPLPPLEMNLGEDVCGLYDMKCAFIPPPEYLRIQKRYDPVHPSYASVEDRIASFKTWPVSIKLKPQELAEAGFFYTGLGDKTVCYHCGGGLKDWAEDDCPWREHALFFSKCSFVLQTKGREFVAEVLGKKPQTLTPEEIQALHIQKESCIAAKSSSLSQGAVSSSCEESLPGNSSSEEHLLKKPVESEHGSKSDLKDQRTTLSQNELVSVKKIEDARACKICFSEEIGVVFLPCGHFVACPKCAASLSNCAVCRQPFNATVRAFLS